MNNPPQLPSVVILCRAGDWDEPNATETDIVQGLQNAGHTAKATYRPEESVAALVASDKPAVVMIDWRVFGIFRQEDFSHAHLYNPLWEWRSVIETYRSQGQVCGVISVYPKGMLGILDWFGCPRAASSDMFLAYPFSAQEIAYWARRMFEFHLSHDIDYQDWFYDDRRKTVL